MAGRKRGLDISEYIKRRFVTMTEFCEENDLKVNSMLNYKNGTNRVSEENKLWAILQDDIDELQTSFIKLSKKKGQKILED